MTTTEGVDLTQVMLSQTGEPFQDGDDTLTLGAVIQQCLVAALEGDEKADATQKLKRYNLFLKVRDSLKAGKAVALKSNQKTMLLDCAGKAYGPLIYGQCHHAIEGDTEED